MCGLAGIVSGTAPPRDLLGQMARALDHRGPDDAGIWTNDSAGIGFAHRRLSIVDLSPLGHQPMTSADGRWVIAYNGEIYNHLELRQELKAAGAVVAWRGHSDTETLVECVARWGLVPTLKRAVGMFAIALWDGRARELSLARDRFGEKPLYYGWIGTDFLFGSELGALRLHPRFDCSLSREALRSLAASSYIAEPHSIYEGIYKLYPGTVLTAPAIALRARRSAPVPIGGASGISVEPYWSYRNTVMAGLRDPITDEAQALNAVEHSLSEAIAGQAVADVPVGAFLSGGVDSSLVVALYQKLWPGKVKSFTIGFDDRAYDEAPFAAKTAAYLGTEHHDLYVSAQDALDVIQDLPRIYDEPFADSSQIATYIVSRMAKQSVTVALSGDGGDELFAGYNRYFGTIRLWSAMQMAPQAVRLGLGRTLAGVDPSAWNALIALHSGTRPAFFGSRVQKVFKTMGRARRLEEFVQMFLDEWAGDDSPVIGAPAPPALDMDLGVGAPDIARMMYTDAMTYLPGDVLTKVDRAAMANSLETRVPFLDHRVAAVAARIPLSMKIGRGGGKVILRKLLYRHVPEDLFNRPKAGFAVPVEQWLRGPLRDWAEALLDERRLRNEGYFNPYMVRERWAALLDGRSRTAGSIWAVLMVQAWLDHQR